MIEERKSGIERHVQTVIQVVITALLLWVGNSVLTLRDSSIRFEEKQTQMNLTLVRLESETNLMRTALANVTALLNNSTVVIQDHERRISKMEVYRETITGKQLK